MEKYYRRAESLVTSTVMGTPAELRKANWARLGLGEPSSR